MSRSDPSHVTPAISRKFTDADIDADVRSTVSNSVTHKRGFGDSGTRIQLVNHECPACSFDRMLRAVDVSPVNSDYVSYYCLNPNCAHYVSDEYSYACHGSYPQRTKRAPEVTD